MKKYTKDILIVIAALIAVGLAVSGDGFSDYANKPFWWKFWTGAAIASFLACVGGFIYLNNKTNK